MNKTDLQLKQDIEAELRWDPKVNAAQIGISVDRGAVSLMGTVDNYGQKWAAEDAAKRVSGVRTIAQDLTVKVLGEHTRTDSDIALAVQNALTWDVFVPSNVTAQVHGGAVTLSGRVSWNYQRDAAERAVRFLAGVVGVSNDISLNPESSTTQVHEKVRAALLRQAKTDSESIAVSTAGGTVTLSGHASSWQCITDAVNAAWAAPGVTHVINSVTISMNN